MEPVDKRKIMTPARAKHMEKMREALRKKKEMEEQEEFSQPAPIEKPKGKKKATPKKTIVVQDEESDEGQVADEETEEEVVVVQPCPKKQPVTKKKASKPAKEEEFYELGKRVYKENKKKALFEEIKAFIANEFEIVDDVVDRQPMPAEVHPLDARVPRGQPVRVPKQVQDNNILSIF